MSMMSNDDKIVENATGDNDRKGKRACAGKTKQSVDANHLDGVHGGGDEDEHDDDGGDGGRV